MSSSGYRMLPHRSDAYVEAWGRGLEDAVSAAARGMMSVMTDLRRVRRTLTMQIPTLHGRDLQELLYTWLEFVMLKYDTERFIMPFSRVKVLKDGSGYSLTGSIGGEPFDAGRHRIKREVKAVTYHAMEVERTARGYVVRFLLDL